MCQAVLAALIEREASGKGQLVETSALGATLALEGQMIGSHSPGNSGGSGSAFILAMNAYANPVLLGGPRFQMMAPLLFWAFNSDNNWPFAGAIAFILMGTTLGLTGLANLMIPRRYQAR